MFKFNQCILMITVGIILSLVISELNATEYPSPPKVPEKFASKAEVEKYLNQLHNYYMIVGRPR